MFVNVFFIGGTLLRRVPFSGQNWYYLVLLTLDFLKKMCHSAQSIIFKYFTKYKRLTRDTYDLT